MSVTFPPLARLAEDQPELSLTGQMRAIEQAHRPWHVFLSDEGRLWASRPMPDGTGMTVDGGTPECLVRAIAQAEHERAVIL